jgi:hypothetical protein
MGLFSTLANWISGDSKAPANAGGVAPPGAAPQPPPNAAPPSGGPANSGPPLKNQTMAMPPIPPGWDMSKGPPPGWEAAPAERGPEYRGAGAPTPGPAPGPSGPDPDQTDLAAGNHGLLGNFGSEPVPDSDEGRLAWYQKKHEQEMAQRAADAAFKAGDVTGAARILLAANGGGQPGAGGTATPMTPQGTPTPMTPQGTPTPMTPQGGRPADPNATPMMPQAAAH